MMKCEETGVRVGEQCVSNSGYNDPCLPMGDRVRLSKLIDTAD